MPVRKTLPPAVSRAMNALLYTSDHNERTKASTELYGWATDEIMQLHYFSHIVNTYSYRNALEEEVANYLQTRNREYIRAEDLPIVFKEIQDKVAELCAKHKRCKPFSVSMKDEYGGNADFAHPHYSRHYNEATASKYSSKYEKGDRVLQFAEKGGLTRGFIAFRFYCDNHYKPTTKKDEPAK